MGEVQDNEPLRIKTYHLICAPNKDKSDCLSAQSGQSFRCLRKETASLGYPKSGQTKILIRS